MQGSYSTDSLFCAKFVHLASSCFSRMCKIWADMQHDSCLTASVINQVESTNKLIAFEYSHLYVCQRCIILTHPQHYIYNNASTKLRLPLQLCSPTL